MTPVGDVSIEVTGAINGPQGIQATTNNGSVYVNSTGPIVASSYGIGTQAFGGGITINSGGPITDELG